jgi:hypothetical protein
VLSLTKDTLDSLFHNIVVADLCKTFQDALYVLEAIGLEHLWIDTLCIVQDDEEDWEREAVLMASVWTIVNTML